MTTSITRDLVCDTCTVQPPVELFETHAFIRVIVGTDALVRYHDAWALCPVCADLVRARSWHALVHRVANHTRDTLHVPDHAIRAELTDLFTHLDRHLTGRTTPIPSAG